MVKSGTVDTRSIWERFVDRLLDMSLREFLLLIVVALMTIVLIAYLIRGLIAGNTDVQYGFDWASGNWSADSRPTSKWAIGNFTFSLSAVGAVALNLANFVAVGSGVLWIWRYTKRTAPRESIMKLADFLPMRDVFIRTRLMDLLFEELPKENRDQFSRWLMSVLDAGLIQRAFEEGDEAWNKTLPTVFDDEAQKRYHQALRTKVTAHTNRAGHRPSPT